MSPTIHVQLFPTTFPPANIDLEAEKRSFHRRLSTRRLEAARRGTTPLFLDLDSKKDPITTNSPTSPRTRAVRRKGQLFNSPTSTISSTESGYLFSNDANNDSPSSSSSSSTCSVSSLAAGDTVTNSNHRHHLAIVSGKYKAGGNKAKTTKPEGPQQLAQPFLLQLRSLPVPLTTNINPSNPAAIIDSKSLSPTSSCFNMLSTPSSHSPCDLSFDAKRRKLAKLQRFLGENIPPELVFPSSTTTTTPITSSTTSPLQRSTSVLESSTSSRGKVLHKPSRSISTSKTPTPLSATAPTTPQSTTREPRTTDVEQQQPTTPRPQSMTTVPSPTMATMATTPSTRGASLDGVSPNLPFQNIMDPKQGTTPADQRRYRKEGKGWSGEWNVKDMEQVANALRGLKVR